MSGWFMSRVFFFNSLYVDPNDRSVRPSASTVRCRCVAFVPAVDDPVTYVGGDFLTWSALSLSVFVVGFGFDAAVSFGDGIIATYFGFLWRAIFSLCNWCRRIYRGDGIGGGSGRAPSIREDDGANSMLISAL